MRRTAAIAATAFVALALASCSYAAHAHPGRAVPQRARSLVMSRRVAAELVRAAAGINGHVPVAQYAGFEPSSSHYAYDPATRTYWAAGSLRPRTDSSAAAVAVQDDGSYNVFRRSEGGSWRAYDTGLAGVGGTSCPVQLPGAVLRLWGWRSGSCRAGKR